MNIIPLLHGFAGIQNSPVFINDKNSPVIIPFGPVGCGKTMLMCRLFRYLRQEGYQIIPEWSFLPAPLLHEFKREVENLSRFIFNGSNFVPLHLPLLFKIISNHGIPLFHFLDQDGLEYYDIYEDNSSVRLLEILKSPNRKIWLFMLDDLGRDGQIGRECYVKKIIQLKDYISEKDKIVFVFPKVDKHDEMFRDNGKVNEKELLQLANERFPYLFKHFKTEHPIKRLFKPYVFDFCAFSAGDYYYNYTRYKEECIPSEDFYPENLWRLISKK